MYQSPYSGMGMNPVAMYQQRLQQMQAPYQQQQYVQAQGLKGRIVTGMEEARAAQIDLDGSVFVFPSLSENKIYTKTIGLDGLPIFETYEKIQPKDTSSKQADAISSLQKRIDDLEKRVEGVYEYGFTGKGFGGQTDVRQSAEQNSTGKANAE